MRTVKRVTKHPKKLWRGFRRFEKEIRNLAAFAKAIGDIIRFSGAAVSVVLVLYHLIAHTIGYAPLVNPGNLLV